MDLMKENNPKLNPIIYNKKIFSTAESTKSVASKTTKTFLLESPITNSGISTFKTPMKKTVTNSSTRTNNEIKENSCNCEMANMNTTSNFLLLEKKAVSATKPVMMNSVKKTGNNINNMPNSERKFQPGIFCYYYY